MHRLWKELKCISQAGARHFISSCLCCGYEDGGEACAPARFPEIAGACALGGDARLAVSWPGGGASKGIGSIDGWTRRAAPGNILAASSCRLDQARAVEFAVDGSKDIRRDKDLGQAEPSHVVTPVADENAEHPAKRRCSSGLPCLRVPSSYAGS